MGSAAEDRQKGRPFAFHRLSPQAKSASTFRMSTYVACQNQGLAFLGKEHDDVVQEGSTACSSVNDLL